MYGVVHSPADTPAVTLPAYTGPERRRAGRPWAGRAPATSTRRAERRVASGSAANIGPGRTALHVLAGVAGWAGFAALWVWQIRVFVPHRWFDGVQLIAVLVAAFGLVTPVWVWWNRNIYRRRHRRTAPMVRPVQFERDSLGRRLVISSGVRLNPAEVIVTAGEDGASKRYEAAPVARKPPAAAPIVTARSA
jgi:hypothetical protein